MEILLRIFSCIGQSNLGSLYTNFCIRNDYYNFYSNINLTQPERYGDIYYSFNEYGFRDKNDNPDKEEYNIVLLGDSVAFGLGVQQNLIYASLLSDKLNEYPPKGIHIINLAIPGYGGKEELAVLQKIGLHYRPNLVILNFYMNDYFDALRDDFPVTVKNRVIALNNILLNKSLTYMRLRQIFDGLTYWLFHNARRNYFIESLNDEEPKNVTEYLISRPEDRDIKAFEYLRSINLVIKENKSKLLIIITPNEIQLFNKRYDLSNERLRLFCKNNDIDCYDMLPHMRAHIEKADLFNDGIHLSKRGHEFVAEILAKQLEEKYCYGVKERGEDDN